MVFETELYYIGYEERMNRAGDRKYTLIKYLDDEGRVFSTLFEVFEGNVNLKSLRYLQRVKVKIRVVVSRYVQLQTVELQSVDASR